MRRTVKVQVTAEQSDSLVALLHVKIEPKSHTVDQTGHFWNAEHHFFTKIITMKDLQAYQDSIAIQCSNADVIVDLSKSSEQQLKLKCFCGPAPEVLYFCLVAFADPFMATPVRIYQIYVHSVVLIFHGATLGEVSRATIAFQSSVGSRSAQCFSSCPDELIVRIDIDLSSYSPRFRCSRKVLSRCLPTHPISLACSSGLGGLASSPVLSPWWRHTPSSS